jgi:integrase
MASLQSRGDNQYCQFYYRGRRHTFAIGKVSDAEAEAWAGRVDHLLMRIRQRLLAVPDGVDIVDFLLADGRVTESEAPAVAEKITFARLRDRYLETHRNGALEETTLEGIALYMKHLATTLGERFPMHALSPADLQRHVDRRAAMRGFRGMLSPATIRKAIVPLRTAWNWAVQTGLLSGRFPAQGLRYPKLEEKPPFQTRAEIERRVAAGGLTGRQVDELWDAPFLTREEIDALLGYVERHATQPWVYPRFRFAAHTGARRSEMLRMQVADVDFAGGAVFVREKKRARGRRTTRRVPLTPFLARVLGEWLSNHPGLTHLFCQRGDVPRSKTRRSGPTPVTPDEAHDHLRRTLAGSEWAVLRGYHALRRSYISLCVMRGID